MLYLSGVAERIANDLNARQINAGRNFLWHKSKRLGESLIIAKLLQQYKYEDIDADDGIIDHRLNRAVRIVVADGEHLSGISILVQNTVDRKIQILK